MTANPLYDSWKSLGLVYGEGLMGWDVSSKLLGHGDAWIKKTTEVWTSRHVLTRQYAWAIPSPEAISWIVERTKSIIEIGAGRGYWAKLLAAAGAEVFAYDTSIVQGRMGKNGWHNPRSKLAPDYLSSPDDEPGTLYFPVQRGGAAKAAKHPDSTLMLCWPPHSSSMARDCLRQYQREHAAVHRRVGRLLRGQQVFRAA